MKVIAETIRNAPGRAGILAEEKRYSTFDEELITRDFFQDRKGGFFVDVGCAWPIIASNTYYLEAHLGWTGIGIDALQDYAAAWREKRPNSKFFTFLVTDRSGADGTFFKSPKSYLSSTSLDHASGMDYGDPMVPEKIEVPMITLDDLLDHEGIEKIDLLSMDVEGHETRVAKVFQKYFHDHGYERIERYAPFDLVNHYFQPVRGAVPTGPSPSGS